MLNAINTTIDAANPFKSAYDATAAERSAVSAAEVLPVNVDIPTAVTTAFGVISRLGALRPDMEAKLPTAYLDVIAKTELYAQAISYAHTLYLTVVPPPEQLRELGEQALRCREMLLADAKALAIHGFFDPKPLADLKGGPGYVNTATDLSVLAQLFRERWADIAQKTALTPSKITEAEALSNQISRAVGDRAQQAPQVAEVNETRQRAFTLFVNAYDQVRKLVAFVRWEKGDADKLAPSLWANRGRAGRGSNTDMPAKVDPTAPTDPGPAIAPAPTAPAAPIGHPGSSPFVDN